MKWIKRIFWGYLSFGFAGSTVLEVYFMITSKDGFFPKSIVTLFLGIVAFFSFRVFLTTFNSGNKSGGPDDTFVTPEESAPIHAPEYSGRFSSKSKKDPETPDVIPFIKITTGSTDQINRSGQDEEYETPKGAQISYLDAQALEFWNKKRTDYAIPDYYSETAFGRNVKPALQRLLKDGYLELGDIRQRISLKTVPELKAILADRELKVSGIKKELVSRIISNFDEEELDDLFPINVYHLTKKGEDALLPYSIIRANNNHSLGLSHYRLFQAKEENPEETDDSILKYLLLEDVQASQERKDRSGYQNAIFRLARFLYETGNHSDSFEAFSLAYFMWTRNLADLQVANIAGQSAYMAKYLEDAGIACGYGLEEVLVRFKSSVSQKNPFGLASEQNICFSVNTLKNTLGVH